ncbi:hypothetical protein QBC33DRAFT_551251 [Phialemonium atrogriseum]|uniref:Uncharacterized protein n=1 Tax=Phialemonium atrogriseum TaxID=1093897 RepID=A0AAJ0FBU0_9PEZI|nr:uncharacterized protein QBC33DRAFT_551251 [Phialemonium atrogriseum]KAK1762866.1 hypothetical protein QBC33DRAFT_551251 [Phialemonium atrogriseum]
MEGLYGRSWVFVCVSWVSLACVGVLFICPSWATFTLILHLSFVCNIIVQWKEINERSSNITSIHISPMA